MTDFATNSYLGEISKVFLALGIVVALIVLLARYLPKLLKTSGCFKQDSADFYIKQRIALGPRRQVILLKKDNIELLLGVTDSQISLLKDLSLTSEEESSDSSGYLIQEDQ